MHGLYDSYRSDGFGWVPCEWYLDRGKPLGTQRTRLNGLGQQAPLISQTVGMTFRGHYPDLPKPLQIKECSLNHTESLIMM